MNENIAELQRWFSESVHPFIAEHAPGRLEEFAGTLRRIEVLDRRVREDLPICFLGASGVGKSTLINALVAGAEPVLPSGGIGPLTALAMEVRHGDSPAFQASYHPAATLWRGVVFSLEQGFASELAGATGVSVDTTVPSLLGVSESDVSVEDAADVSSGEPEHGRLELIRKQAQLLVTGNQDGASDLPYLLDCLREACGVKRKWGTETALGDAERIGRLKVALDLARKKLPHQANANGNLEEFRRELRRHAAGFLAPLIRSLRVQWRSPFLQSGIVLVDLPGLGVAGDVFKETTRKWVVEKAKAIVLVVDRAGITEASADLLRSSGFLTRLLFSADEREHDPVLLAVAVAKLDDVAASEWELNKSRKKYEHLAEQFTLASTMIRNQIRGQLELAWDSGDEKVRHAQRSVIDQLVADLAVFPISAPQYRKLLAADDDDRAFIREASQSGIPTMQERLSALVNQRRHEAKQAREESVYALTSQVLAQAALIEAQWAGDGHAEEEVKALEEELRKVLAPMRKEFLVRQGQFRECLKNTIPQKIESLVAEAKESASKEIRRYLRGLRDAHWATLRAAVRREGTFYGARHINLPDDFSRRFVEPIAEIWGRAIIQEIRKRTREFAADCGDMVLGVSEWCRAQGARVPGQLLEAQIEAIKADTKQIDLAGRATIDGLRDRVKNELTDAIEKPIRRKCVAFVKKGDDIGTGVKHRILELFDDLGDEVSDAAAGPAADLLLTCFKEVRDELKQVFKDLEDPLENAADAILSAHRRRLERADDKRRDQVLSAIAALRTSCPPDILPLAQGEAV